MSRSNSIWLDVRTGLNELLLQEYHRPYTNKFWSRDDQNPQIVMFIGDESKTISMRKLFSLQRHNNDCRIHLQVPSTRAAQSGLLVADCGLHNARSLETAVAGPVPADIDQRSMPWHQAVPASHDPYGIAVLIYSRLLSPFSTVICLFADDLGGTSQVAKMLVGWIETSKMPVDLPPSAYPRVLILVEWDDSIAGSFDEKLATIAFMKKLSGHIYARRKNGGQGEAEGEDSLRNQLLVRQFSSLRVIALPLLNPKKSSERLGKSWATLGTRIQQESSEVQKERRKAHMEFSASHFKAFFHCACDHFAADLISPFNFVAASRSRNPVPQDIAVHLKNFLRNTTQVMAFAVPVIASALSLDSYPPGMHLFEPSTVFQSLYFTVLQDVQCDLYTSDRDFFGQIYESIKSMYCRQISENVRDSIDSAAAHRAVLAQFSSHWKSIYNYKSCFACTVRGAENTLSCRHSLCDPCVMIHRRTTPLDDPWKFTLDKCPLCQGPNTIKFTIKPYTAGIRGLSIDGASGDDIAHFLTALQDKLRLTFSTLQEYFDIVVGAGSGSKFVLGIFCKGWTLQRCLTEFQRLSAEGHRSPRLLTKVPDHWRPKRLSYNSTLNELFGSGKLFECAGNGTKVAIAATRKRDGAACIFSNYNGPGERPSTYGYSLIRPESMAEEAQICDLAGMIGGSLHGYLGDMKGHNSLISWEQDFLWYRTKKAPDILVSFGMSAETAAKSEYGTLERESSPFYPWPVFRSDDDEGSISSIREALLASLFYVEVVPPVVLINSRFVCQLQIRCRLAPSPALQDLTRQLHTSRARFYYGLQESILCVDPQLYEEEKNKAIPFSRLVKVTAISRNDTIDIKVDGIINKRQSISNCPYVFKTLVHDQGLDWPFGHRDHRPIL